MRVNAVGYFCRGALSLMFDGILNATLSEVSTTRAIQARLCLRFPPLGLYKQILHSPYFLILLIHNKHKTIRWNFGLAPRFYSLDRELPKGVDKAKNVWLIIRQLPIKAEWWEAPFGLPILAEAISKTIFPSIQL